MTESEKLLPDGCREAFEEWYSSIWDYKNLQHKRADGSYTDPTVNIIWLGWRSCWNTRTPDPRIQELEDLIDEYLHWRSVNKHIKGGENYLKRMKQGTHQQPA